jgi:hypothetical protein
VNDDLSDLFEGERLPMHGMEWSQPPTEPAFTLADVSRAIDMSQSAFQPVADELTGLYRNLDKTYRKDIKLKLKAVYEKLADLGATFGISKLSMASLWKG